MLIELVELHRVMAGRIGGILCLSFIIALPLPSTFTGLSLGTLRMVVDVCVLFTTRIIVYNKNKLAAIVMDMKLLW